MCCGTEAGSYLRLIDSCITQLKAHGPSRTCNESKEDPAAQVSALVAKMLPRVLGHLRTPEFRLATFGVWGSGFRVQGSGFRVQGSGFRVQMSWDIFAPPSSGHPSSSS